MYETIQGDTWDVISKKMYDSEYHTDILIKANAKHADTVIFSSGVLLEVPVFDTIQQFADLPPWKRGDSNAGA